MLYKIRDKNNNVVYEGDFDNLDYLTGTAFFVHGVGALDIARMPELNVPVIPNIDSKILNAISRDGDLDMESWHHPLCETTHCRGGWAIHLAGQAGRDLEERTCTSMAAKLIYAASRPDMEVPNFYATNEEAMADLERCAALEKMHALSAELQNS